MKIDRPHRINGELVGYHISASCDSKYRGKFISLKVYNELQNQKEVVNVEKKQYQESLISVNEVNELLESVTLESEQPKRGRKKK